MNIATRPSLARTAAPHLVLILLASCAVYGFRDIWPLTTYTLQPIDTSEGARLWIKIALFALAGIVIPLTVPRQYIPVDPEVKIQRHMCFQAKLTQFQNPSERPNPEQTCSILSLITYSFLDKPIYTVYNAPQLASQTLPPLADYDRTTHLVKRSFKHLDIFSGARRQHMFFALMRVFSQYIIATRKAQSDLE